MIITYSCQTTRALNGRSPEGSFSSTQGVIISGHSRNRLFYHRILFQDRIRITMETNCFCQWCNKRLSTPHQFKMHMNTHHGIKAYVCEICGNRFSSHGSKHNHMRRHGNASPFTCPLCQKPFVWELSLKGHLKSHAKQGHITASKVDEIYLQQRTEHKLKKKVQKLCRALDLMMMEQSSPENNQGVSMPSKKYETHHEATAYNLNTTLPATSDIENQHPQLQQQQTVFHTTAGFCHGPCSSNATYPYNGRYEMINAGKTAENGIPSSYVLISMSEDQLSNSNTNEPYNGRYEIINAGNTAENENGYRCSDANQPYNFRYGVIKAENSAENAERTASKVMKKDHQMPLSEMSSSTDLCVMVDKAILFQKHLLDSHFTVITALFLVFLFAIQLNIKGSHS
ncbi:PR domain zinc finger protein 5 [Trichinella papuae]|uniref:PR domain zinc finger protein 5 n=1 Tax=Trichinella papuae TaxID=268474 RepID=A0A0V1M7E1_9BILA|nr:PR domain zinc finger protein 5 [Trichinella papuae]